MPGQNDILQCSQPVAEALAGGQNNIVALESTIITHGMPYPENVETAMMLETLLRRQGVVPATCAVLNGKLRAGLSASEIEMLGKIGPGVTKASRRDLPYLLQQKKPGATTVAATMIIARMAGIRVFATGGIGGVHRGAATTMDISADLQELARTPVAVVSAGVKSILDIGLTLEYLETLGVPVIGYQTHDFPAFYSRESGYKTDFRLDTPKEIADLLRYQWALEEQGGVLIANPVPEADQLPLGYMEKLIEQALLEAGNQGVAGKAITPFLLARIKDLSGGKSLKANIALVKSNVMLAGEIASSLLTDPFTK